jgi:hypothetical protein
MKIIPKNKRILATELPVEITENEAGVPQDILRFKEFKVVASDSEVCKKGDIIVAPGAVDTFVKGKKKYAVIHESDINLIITE